MNKFQQIPSKLSEVYLVEKKKKQRKRDRFCIRICIRKDFTVGETGPFFIRTLKAAAAASAAFLQHN